MIVMSKVFDLIQKEQDRQDSTIELIASENFVSEDVLRAAGSCLTNKYAEGYPGKRYYGGCGVVDELELYCQQEWKKVFKTGYHVNVQPLSGTHANMVVYSAALNPGDTILSLDLQMGGHISHGLPISMTGKLYNVKHYGLDRHGFIDMGNVERMARCCQPKLIIAGASAYSRKIDFKEFADIAHNCGALLMADIAHIAGLVAARQHPTPFGYADFVTTTTQKTLRGIRGGLIFCKPEYAKKVDSALFPGLAGGPHMHTIAAKAVTAEEALEPDFVSYIRQVKANAKAMAAEFTQMGYEVVTGGTDNHMFLLNFTHTHPNLTGKAVQDALDKDLITLNKNSVPNESRSPMQTSGVRIGTAAMTTKGFKEAEFIAVAHIIDSIIRGLTAPDV